MKTVWEDQLDQMLDQVAEYAEDWEQCINMIEAEPESKELHEYLTLLVPRLQLMQRRFNRVEYDAKNRWWKIKNYTYKMWKYMKQKYDPVITPNTIIVEDEALTLTDRDNLLQQC